MHRVARGLGAAVLAIAPLLFTVDPASPQVPPSFQCQPPSATATHPGDFLTGGGFIVNATGSTTPGEKANFGVGGGCKQGGGGHGLWGHLEYIDHSIGLNVHWTTITAYRIDPNDPMARVICGTASTNLYGDVNFAVRAADHAQSGGVDEFDINLTNSTGTTQFYSSGVLLGIVGTPHPLVGGNIVLHEPNPSTMGSISDSCIAFFTGPNIF